MHSVTHFLVGSSLLLLIGSSLPVAITFAFLFAVLIDLDILVGWSLGKPRHHGRTWVQEPFGLLLVGAPLGIVMERFLTQGFLLVTIPYASHIAIDYLSKHEVTPLAPFGRENCNTGVFRRLGAPAREGVSEWYVLTPAIILSVMLAAVRLMK